MTETAGGVPEVEIFGTVKCASAWLEVARLAQFLIFDSSLLTNGNKNGGIRLN